MAGLARRDGNESTRDFEFAIASFRRLDDSLTPAVFVQLRTKRPQLRGAEIGAAIGRHGNSGYKGLGGFLCAVWYTGCTLNSVVGFVR
jgi:hypothetical protein